MAWVSTNQFRGMVLGALRHGKPPHAKKKAARRQAVRERCCARLQNPRGVNPLTSISPSKNFCDDKSLVTYWRYTAYFLSDRVLQHFYRTACPQAALSTAPGRDAPRSYVGKSDRPINHSSTARAHWRTSRMAHTMRIPRLSGHRFHGKLDTQSAGNWTLIPGQPGHLFQGKLDT